VLRGGGGGDKERKEMGMRSEETIVTGEGCISECNVLKTVRGTRSEKGAVNEWGAANPTGWC